MDWFGEIDWGKVFLPDTPVLEIFARGTITYLALFAMLRFVLKRQSGGVGIGDLLVIVMIADASQNAMAGTYNSVLDGLLLVATIIGWSYALDWLAFRSPLVSRIVYPPPLSLIKDGQLNRRHMQKELITYAELISQLREQGVDDISKVRRACIEGDGRISIVLVEGAETTRHEPPRRAG